MVAGWDRIRPRLLVVADPEIRGLGRYPVRVLTHHPMVRLARRNRGEQRPQPGTIPAAP